MNRIRLVRLAAFAAIALASSRASALTLANPGFEDPITMDGAPFVGFWEGFSGGAGASAENSNVDPRSGALHLELSIVNTDNTFAGVFQDIPGVLPGGTVTFSGWHKTISSPLDLDAEIRIEWRNAAGTAEVGRTPNTIPVLTSEYAPFSLSAAVPAGAGIARVVYAIQTFSGGPTNNGTVYLDDIAVVPEPASAVLTAVALAALSGMARRRRSK